MHPLTATELGKDFNLLDGLKYGALPLVVASAEKERYLNGYVNNYLQQEIIQEGISRNVSSFARFLETASFSQGSVLNVSEVAREARVARKVVEDYFCALEDLLIGVRMPVFSRRAKRRLVYHRKFYYFDAGIYRVLRPTGPFDDSDMIFGAALETLLFQNLRAVNDYLNFKYKLYYFRTAAGAEVDFILYGPIGLKAFEVKSKKSVFRSDISGLKVFLDDYPEARGYLIYGGDRRLYFGNIEVWPAEEALKSLPEILK
jgi:predicted AAA+ superfamily ATPase